MRRMRRISSCEKGATVVEFALLAPVFLTFLFGTIEGSRIMWTKHTLDEVAFATARCMSVSTACETQGAQQAFARDRAADYGIDIALADVTLKANADCRGFPDSSRVTITHQFDSVMGGIMPDLAAKLEADSCFPQL